MEQVKQLENPDARVVFDKIEGELLGKYADVSQGISPGDTAQLRFNYCEFLESQKGWMLMHSTPNEHSLYSGCSYVIKKPTHLFKEKYSGFRLCGDKYWGEKGFVVGKMKALPVAIYLGTAFDANAPILVPKNVKHYAAIGCYLKSGEYLEGVRFLDQKLDVAVAVLNKVPFDLEHWSAIADEQYPNGLPQPYSNDPTQWIFHGHPAGSVIW